MQNIVKCKVHPKYKAIRRPQCDCLDCWKMFCFALEEKLTAHNSAMDAICPYYKVNDLAHHGDCAGTVECTCFGRPGKHHQ